MLFKKNFAGVCLTKSGNFEHLSLPYCTESSCFLVVLCDSIKEMVATLLLLFSLVLQPEIIWVSSYLVLESSVQLGQKLLAKTVQYCILLRYLSLPTFFSSKAWSLWRSDPCEMEPLCFSIRLPSYKTVLVWNTAVVQIKCQNNIGISTHPEILCFHG